MTLETPFLPPEMPFSQGETARLGTESPKMAIISVANPGRRSRRFFLNPFYWDGAKELITGDAEAAKLMSRPYRAPWVYPAM